MTVATETTNTYSESGKAESRARRVEAAKALKGVENGAKVIGVHTDAHQHLLGKTCTVNDVDSADSTLTVLVGGVGDERGAFWVYEVAPVEEKPTETIEVSMFGPEAQAKIDELQAEIVLLTQQRDTYAQARDAARQEMNEVRAKHERFREQVREVAIRVADENSWCDNGLNEVLDELGLERKERAYQVEVKVTAYAYKSVEVEATSEEEAAEKACEMFDNGDEDLNDMDWTVDDTEANQVEEA